MLTPLRLIGGKTITRHARSVNRFSIAASREYPVCAEPGKAVPCSTAYPARRSAHGVRAMAVYGLLQVRVRGLATRVRRFLYAAGHDKAMSGSVARASGCGWRTDRFTREPSDRQGSSDGPINRSRG